MPDLPPGQLEADTAMFLQPGPEEVGIAKKLTERQEAMRKRDEAKLTPKQLESADKFAETMKHEDEKEVKAALLRKITDYARSFPDRIRSVNPKKLPTMKNSLEDIQTTLGDIERDLGRTSSVDMMTLGYLTGMQVAEAVGPRFKIKTQHLGQVAVQQEPSIRSLMEEFCIKYDNWFGASIERRIIMFTVNMIVNVHRTNERLERDALQRASVPASDKMKEEADSL